MSLNARFRHRLSAADQAAFAQEMTAVNLQRAKIAAVAGSMMALWTVGLSMYIPELRFPHLLTWLVTVLAIYASLMILRLPLLQPGADERLRRAYALVFAVAFIVICDGFSFVLSGSFTSVSSFSRGMLVVAVIFVLRPPVYVAIAVINEMVLCGWFVHRGVNVATLTALLDGTAGAVVGTAGSLMLYFAKRAEFMQQRVIARHHEEMNELMAITAHDLRSPLLGMKNMLALARTRGLEGERLRSIVEEAAKGCERMLQLVSNVVWAHAAEEMEPAAPERGDLSAAVVEAVDRARAVAEPKAQRLALQTPAGPALACYDATALGQVLDNLLGNAVKFSPTGATIETILVARNGSWRIEIADDGPGIPSVERQRLFGKFTRGSALPTGGEASSGLGLFIADTLVQRMGGRLEHAPREPRGSIFAIELPRPGAD